MKSLPTIVLPLFAVFSSMPLVAEEGGGDLAVVAPPELVGKGNEPHWHLRIADGRLWFRTPEGEKQGDLEAGPGEDKDEPGGVIHHTATLDGAKLTVTFTPGVTMDSMSGMPHPSRVVVTLPDGEQLVGVGGDPLDLLVGAWRVVKLGDDSAGDDPPTIEFARDGGVFGHAGCNRFHGKFTLTGEGLAFPPLATTRRLCDPPAMAREGEFLRLMASVDGFTINAEGGLVLSAAETPAIVAVRP